MMPDVLLGIKAAAEEDVANRISHHDTEEEHDHEDFESFVIELPEISDIETLHNKIVTISELYDVLRVKGFVRVAGRPLPYLVQAVGRRVDGHFEIKPGRRAGSLVIIGRKGLDRQSISKVML